MRWLIHVLQIEHDCSKKIIAFVINRTCSRIYQSNREHAGIGCNQFAQIFKSAIFIHPRKRWIRHIGRFMHAVQEAILAIQSETIDL